MGSKGQEKQIDTLTAMVTLRTVRPVRLGDRVKEPPLFPETHTVQNQKGIAGVLSFLQKLLTF